MGFRHLSYLFISLQALSFVSAASVSRPVSIVQHPGPGAIPNETSNLRLPSRTSSTPNGTFRGIPPEWTILGTTPPIRLLSSIPHSQKQMDCHIWTDAIIAISERFVNIMREKGHNTFVPSPGWSFVAGPVSLVVTPWYGARRRFSVLALSTVVSEIWQVLVADGCRTYDFEIVVGEGHGVKEGDHIGSLEILYSKSPSTVVSRARWGRSANSQE